MGFFDKLPLPSVPKFLSFKKEKVVVPDDDDLQTGPVYIPWDDPYEIIVLSLFIITSICVAILVLVLPYQAIVLSFVPLEIFFNQLYGFAMRIKFWIETILGVLLFLMCVHRFIGYFVSMYLQNLLLKPNGGFNMSVDWISLRLGLDHNEIILVNFTWHNPPSFKSTPYFVNIQNFSITFKFLSLFDAIKALAQGKKGRKVPPVEIMDIELSGSNVYIEKSTRKSEGLNLWACLGAESEDGEKDVQESVTKAMANALESTASGATGLVKNIGSLAADGVKNVGHLAVDGVMNVKSTLTKAVSFGKKTHKKDSDTGEDKTNDSKPNDTDVHETEDSKGNAIDSGNGDPIGDENGSDDDSNDDGDNADSCPNDNEELMRSNSEAALPSSSDAPDTEKTIGWGVPLRFNVKAWVVRDLKLHAQDFLNAQHTDAKDASFIHLHVMNMHHRELSGRPRRKGRPREPLYLDDLVWKVINKAIGELLATNKLSLVSIVASAAANQTTDAVVGAAHNTVTGIKDVVFNYNPLNFTRATARTIKNVVRSSSNRRAAQDMEAMTLSVKVVSIRDLVDDCNIKPASTLCTLQVIEEDPALNGEPFRTNIRSHDRSNLTVFKETFEVAVYSASAQLYIEVFAPLVLQKKVKICAAKIPIETIVSELELAQLMKESDATSKPIEQLGSAKAPEEVFVSGWYQLHSCTPKVTEVSDEVIEEFPVLGEIKLSFQRVIETMPGKQ